MVKKNLCFVLILFVLFFVLSCAGHSVREEDPDAIASGSFFSSADLNKVKQEVIDSLAESSFISGFKAKNEKPVIMMSQKLKNNTDEHIPTDIITGNVRSAIINKGLARFIDDQSMRKAISQLKLQLSDLFSDDKVTEIGNFLGAQYLLRGTISNLRIKTSNKNDVFYSVNLIIVSIETLEIVWTQETQIRRITKKSKLR